MHTAATLTALAALAQESRLSVYRLLVKAGADGLPGRDIAQALGITPSALSFHLKELAHASLLTPRQAGPSITYSANLETMKGRDGLPDGKLLPGPSDRILSIVAGQPGRQRTGRRQSV